MAKDLRALFHADPPGLPGDVKALFCDREDELAFAVEQLRGSKSRQVYAIHGTRRSGKSHFAHRLLLAVEDERLPYRCVAINAFNRNTVRAVLVEAYFQFSRILLGLSLEKPHHEEERKNLLALKPLVDRDRSEFSTEASRKVGAGGELSVAATVGVPNVVSGTGTTKASASLEDTSKLAEKLTSLTDRDVVTVLERAARLCGVDASKPRILMLFDDLDLVDQNGKDETPASNELLNLIRPLAENPDVAVIATVSNRYIDGQEKLFSDLTELGPMPQNFLRDAYQRRVERFHDGVDVFDDEALSLLVQSAQGRVGIFFNNCFEAFRKAGVRAKLPLGREALDAYARWKVEVWSTNERYVGVLKAVGDALRSGATEVTLADDVRKTALHMGLLNSVVGRATTWAINPLFARAFE